MEMIHTGILIVCLLYRDVLKKTGFLLRGNTGVNMDWNVVVSVQEHGFKPARKLLHEYGKVIATDYFNVIVMQVSNTDDFLEDVRMLYEMRSPLLKYIGRIVPIRYLFTYQTTGDFETQ